MSDPQFETIIFFHVEGHRAGDSESYEQATIKIGRSIESDIQFTASTERSVSKHHAIVRNNANGFELVDMQSTNGTYVNGERVTRTWLNDGDVLRFGVTGPELRVSLPSMSGDLTMVDSNFTGIYRGVSGDEAISLNEPHISDRVAIIRQRRFIRNTMMVAISVGAAMTGFVWSIIEGTGLTPASLYFKSFLFLLAGGLLLTLVLAIYHGKPDRQKAKRSEIIYIAVIGATTIAAICLNWWSST